MPNLSTIYERMTLEHDRVWFTSDPHFGHENIIKFCNRPFKSVGEMNESMFAALRESVRPTDTLAVVGDMCVTKDEDRISSWMAQLPQCSQRILIRGNHDMRPVCEHAGWDLVCDQLEVRVRDETGKKWRVFLNHYPMYSWNGSGKGSLNLHGHTHGNVSGFGMWRNKELIGGRCDVGVDYWSYRPVQLPDILRRMRSFERVEKGAPDY